MSQRVDNLVPPPEDLSVKKRRRRATAGTFDDPWEPFRRSILATNEFYRGLAEAVADSFSVFNREMDAERVAADGLTCSFIEGLAQGNAQFYETMSKASQRVFDHLRPRTDEREQPVAVDIDYERLARLVAAELRKDEPPAKVTIKVDAPPAGVTPRPPDDLG